MRLKSRMLLLAVCFGVTIWAISAAQERAKTAAKRAQPPKFDPATTRQIFFDDVFTKLDGQRPAAAAAATPGGAAPAAVSSTAGTPAATGAATGGGGWSKVISPATIEDEIKAIKLEVAKNVTTPSDFAGRGHKVIRREFSILAMLFAVINEYDGEVRFKKDAPTARNLFARTANNTKAGGNTNVFNEAKSRKGELDELLNGSSLPQSDAETPDWPTIVDRVPMMQRLEQAFQTKVSPAMASKDEFAKNTEMIVHETELLAAIATVLTKEGMNDATDETYKGFANTMKQAGGEIVDAVKLNSYDQARAAAGKITKACDQCHEAYR